MVALKTRMLVGLSTLAGSAGLLHAGATTLTFRNQTPNLACVVSYEPAGGVRVLRFPHQGDNLTLATDIDKLHVLVFYFKCNGAYNTVVATPKQLKEVGTFFYIQNDRIAIETTQGDPNSHQVFWTPKN